MKRLSQMSNACLHGIYPAPFNNMREQMKSLLKKLKPVSFDKSTFLTSPKNGAGFTLIELLVVIALIALLAGALVMLVNPFAQFQRTRDSQRKSDLAQIQRALEQYYNDFGKYPTSTAGTTYIIQDESNVTHDWGTPWNPYINVIPKDPTSTQNYIYSTANSRQTYRLYAHLERTTDPMACNQTGANCASAPGSLCGSSISCNYGVTSSDSSP